MREPLSRRDLLGLGLGAVATSALGPHLAGAATLPAPGPGTTGVPAGTSLTIRNGDMTTTADNQVIEGIDLRGSLNVRHRNVLVRNCRIDGKVVVPERSTHSVRLEWCTIRNTRLLKGLATALTGLSFYRCDLGGYNDCIHIRGTDVTIEECWIHSLYRWTMSNGKPVHCDAFETTAGQRIKIIGNRWDAYSYVEGQNPDVAAGPTVSCLMITSGLGRTDDILVQGNTFRGKTIAHLYVVKSLRPTNVLEPTNVRFIDNWFDKGYGRALMIRRGTAPMTWTNNRWLDSGAVIARPTSTTARIPEVDDAGL